LKYIPKDVFDKRAIEKNQVVFTDVSYIEVTPHYDKGNGLVSTVDQEKYKILLVMTLCLVMDQVLS